MDEVKIICSFTYLNPIEHTKEVIDLERSEYVKARKHYLKTLKIPMLRQVERNLGPKIAQVVYDNAPTEQKIALGLLPPLEGAGDTLWTSPSDLLIGKVCLKPPLTNKYIKALTHQGILEMGRQIEQKYWNQMEMEKDSALEQQKRELLQCFENELKKALVCLGVKLHDQCVARIKTISNQFEIQLIDMLRMQDVLMRVEFSYRLQEIKGVVNYHEIICQKAMEAAVAQTVKAMSQLFLKDLEEQQKVLCEYFGNALKNLELKKNYEAEIMMIKVREMLKTASHHMQCRNIANMMYIMCMERKKCNEEKCAIEAFYNKELAEANAIINRQAENISKLMEARHIKTQEVKIREQCMIRILSEFQKFINFALKAAPTQAEFLLSIEKMMVFELAEALKQVEVKPKPKKMPPIRKWQQPKSRESDDYFTLFAHDYHSCLKEQQLRISKDENIDVLPAFYFKDRLYVREDFRDMVMAGVDINSDHELWTPDVDILIEKIREAAVKEPPPYKLLEEEEKEHLPPSVLKKPDAVKKHGSVVLEIPHEGLIKPGDSQILEPEEDEDVCGKRFTIEPCEPAGISKISDMKEVADTVDYEKIGQEELRQMLLATRDSKEIYKKRMGHIYTGPPSTIESESVCEPLIEPGDYMNIEDYLRWMKEAPEGQRAKMMKLHRKVPILEPESISEEKEVTELKPKNTSKVAILVKNDSRFALATRDSIIIIPDEVTQTSSDDFEKNLENHVDSVDVITYHELKPTGSKLLETKNSAELYRKKMPKECTTCSCSAGEMTYSKKTSLTPLPSKDREMLKLDSLEKIYVEEKPKTPPKPKKKLKKTCKVTPKPKCEIVGDKRAKEYLQEPQEFTAERIHSFINLIKDTPDMIRMFTSVTK